MEEHHMKMNFETINYEISLWKNSSLAVDGVSLVQAIRNWWGGKLTLCHLFVKLLDISLTLLDRYFNTDKSEAIAKAYQTLGFSCYPQSRNVILRRYKQLSSIYHPDKGGSLERMREINIARDIILESL